jgi:tyrosine-protein phosphatase non-receptor type 23
LFNLASVCAAVGASQNRFEPAGLKMAFNYCQVSAGMFKFINENFLHPPSADLGRESILILSNLMLMQAQECFIEKTIEEKKKNMMISKLAAHVAHGYTGLVDDLNHPKVKSLHPSLWMDVMRVSFYCRNL